MHVQKVLNFTHINVLTKSYYKNTKFNIRIAQDKNLAFAII